VSGAASHSAVAAERFWPFTHLFVSLISDLLALGLGVALRGMSVVLPRSRHKHRAQRSVLLESSLDSQANRMTERTQPNILITGTPGTGKTTHAELIASELNLKHLNIGDLVREHELHDGYDEEFEAFNMNDDKVSFHLLVG
jgi:hypothetical protein